ncbi:MAG: hypothetical protein IJY11_00405 [Clostridia bacterium]|nr:hypothetical protein [Clostridia bacterium]
MQKGRWLSILQNKEKAGDFPLAKVPLGWEESGEVVFSHRKDRADRYCHTCVTGAQRKAFVMETVKSLAVAYGEGKASFLVLSPHREYAKLLELKKADVTVPYLLSERQFSAMKNLANAQASARKENPRLPKFFVVIDGLEELPFLPKDNAFTFLRKWVDELSGGAEIITAVDFKGSIFAGFEGAFVGVGNSLVSADETGKADVAYVGDGCVLDYPQAIRYTLS